MKKHIGLLLLLVSIAVMGCGPDRIETPMKAVIITQYGNETVSNVTSISTSADAYFIYQKDHTGCERTIGSFDEDQILGLYLIPQDSN